MENSCGLDHSLIIDIIPAIFIGVAIHVYKALYSTLSHERDLSNNTHYNTSDNNTFSKSNAVGVML